MLTRRLVNSSAALRSRLLPSTSRAAVFLQPQHRFASQDAPSSSSDYLSVARVNGVPIVSNWETPSGATHPDPGMTGGYVNPPAQKRQFRDPRGDYWDKQDRRNYGEPVNEDEDILGRFSPEVYTWTSPGMGAVQNGLFILTVFGLAGTVYMFYPDKPSVPRTYPHDGLEQALGGPKAVRALSDKSTTS